MVTLVVFAGLHQAYADEPTPDVPVLTETETASAEKEKAPDIPPWGLHCVREDKCAAIFSEYFDQEYTERMKRLEEREARLAEMEDTLMKDAELQDQSRAVLSDEAKLVRSTATKLVSCASAAMEELSNE